jgi:hypothetical protein
LKSPNHDRARLKSILLTVALATLAPGAPACGPDFPNSLLDKGDNAVLDAPRVDFYAALDLLQLPRTKFKGHNETNFADEAAAADEADLRLALKEKSMPAEKRRVTLENFKRERAKLTNFRNRMLDWNPQGDDEWINGELVRHKPKPRPTLENADLSRLTDVPDEFVDYLQGSMAWFNDDTNQARAGWESLLRRPAGERHYRSTWAAYMLGKSWASEDPEKAAEYFQQVRALRLAGFADRIGLAASSLGEEAQILLGQKKFEAALNLYVAQLATGDSTAPYSLGEVCREIIKTNESVDLSALAANPTTRRIMIAFIIQGWNDDFCNRWLTVMESADVQDVESAEQFALAAYQAGKWSLAQRWIQRAPRTPTAQWLQAKLLLRDGKTSQAALILQRIARDFPAQAFGTNKPGGLEDALYMPGKTYTAAAVSIRDQIQAETGVLHLARRDYAESLDALLRAGFWIDAAYVAERVLTAAELKGYVDQNWPAEKATTETNGNAFNVRENIRGLLGRRLARAGEFDEAHPYYPSGLLASYDAMVSSLDAANNRGLPEGPRAVAFTAAAWIFRTNGMELLGTEVTPDWHVQDGIYTEIFDPTSERQATNSAVATASDDELARGREGVDPALRFHYRYQAAGLAWEAAQLMVDNTVEKARILCTAGSWIKDRDPDAADHFYKALVRHCRKTAIGALADRMRWFPDLDAEGNPIPWKPAPPVETNGPPDQVGLWYVLNRGNTLQDVADAAQHDHRAETTVPALKEANPAINVNRLKAGLIVFVPSP